MCCSILQCTGPREINLEGRSFTDVPETSAIHGGEGQLTPGGRCRHSEPGQGPWGSAQGSPVQTGRGQGVLPAQDPCVSGGPSPPPRPRPHSGAGTPKHTGACSGPRQSRHRQHEGGQRGPGH